MQNGKKARLPLVRSRRDVMTTPWIPLTYPLAPRNYEVGVLGVLAGVIRHAPSDARRGCAEAVAWPRGHRARTHSKMEL